MAHDQPLTDLLRRMAEVTAHFVMPDRRFAPIGDTDRKNLITDEHPDIGGLTWSDEARFVLSGGVEEKPPQELTWLKALRGKLCWSSSRLTQARPHVLRA
jgi:hypothetical protein